MPSEQKFRHMIKHLSPLRNPPPGCWGVCQPHSSRLQHASSSTAVPATTSALTGNKGTNANQTPYLYCRVSYPQEMPDAWECWGCATALCRKLHVSYLHYNRLSSFSADQPLIIQQSFIHPFGEALNCGPFCLSLVLIQVEIRNPRVLFRKYRG